MTDRSIVEAAARLRREREPYLTATVMCVHGSAYRRPGARLLLTRFRWIAGSVSGGCLEGDLSSKGWWSTRSGEPVILTYDPRTDQDLDDDDVRAAFGLGCDGVVEVMLERAGGGRLDPLEFADGCLRAQRRGVVVTVFRSDDAEIPIGARIAVRDGEAPCGDDLPATVREAMLADARAALASGTSCNRSYATGSGTLEALVEAIVPPPRLFVFGAGHDALPVVDLARALGWEIAVCAPDGRASTRQRFVRGDHDVLVGSADELALRIDDHDRSVAIVMGHHYELDKRNLAMLLASRARYIGVLGPRTRTARMLAELGHDADDPRIRAPVGLELGAETPQELALAIVAEIQAVLSHAPAGQSVEADVIPLSAVAV